MKKTILLIILLLILSACGNESDRLNFSGSNENWEMFYVINVSDGDTQEKTGTIKFVGDEETPQSIDYKIKTSAGGSEGKGILLNNDVADLGNVSCENCAVIQENEEISVEITSNGETEKLVLTTNQ